MKTTKTSMYLIHIFQNLVFLVLNMVIPVELQILWLCGKPSLVTSAMAPKLLLITLLLQVKLSGTYILDWLCFYHMVMMVKVQNTHLVESKDTYNLLMMIQELMLNVRLETNKLESLICKYVCHLQLLIITSCWEDKFAEILGNLS